MKSFITSDRAGEIALRLIAALHMLLLAALCHALSIATADAAAPEACSGENLIAAMERDDPALLARIRAEADEVENGGALLWRIERDGAAPSYLFGTMHMSDPRVVDLPTHAAEAFDAAETVVIETTEVLDQSKMMAAMLAQPELMMFTDGTTLSSLVPEDQRKAFRSALSDRGIPPASVDKMKPWMLSAMIALPACELARKAAGAPVLDVRLAEEARADGKTLEGLETIADQLGAMASLPMDFHVRGMLDTLALGDRVDDVIETMIVLYLEGETGVFWPFFRAVLPPEAADDPGYAAFEEAMITARNATMAERAETHLASGGAFIAVGALHLPGPDGLVARFEAAGYRLSPIR